MYIKTEVMRGFNRFKQNLRMHDGAIWSYNTKVATISDGKMIVPKWYSQTTSRHINYAASELGLKVIREYE